MILFRLFCFIIVSNYGLNESIHSSQFDYNWFALCLVFSRYPISNYLINDISKEKKIYLLQVVHCDKSCLLAHARFRQISVGSS